jgi:hypothetical protein
MADVRLRFGVLWAILGGLELLWTLSPPSAAWVEQVYSRGLYPLIAAVLVPVSGFFSFSLTGLSLLLFSAWAVFSLLRSWRGRGFRAWLGLWVRRAAIAAIVIYGLFLLLWGANYQRQPIETLLGLESVSARPVTSAEVEALTAQFVSILQQTAPQLGQRDGRRALLSLEASLERTVKAIDGHSPTLPQWVKLLPPGMLLRFGYAGITSPFWLEPHVDGGLPEVARLAVSVHELAHASGFAGEADADTVAMLAGLHARDPYARYAVALRLFGEAVAQLPAGVARKFYEELPGAARIDLHTIQHAEARYYSPVPAALTNALYGRYLKSQRVTRGVKDYSRTITLLVLAKRKGYALGVGMGAKTSLLPSSAP